MSREQVLAAVSAANVRKHVEHITTEIPSRLAGSPNAKRMAEYSLHALRDAGAEARMHELPGLVSFPEKAELRVLAPREIAIEANTLGHSVPTLADGISGELMDVASGGFADYQGRDATGKISMSELSYQPARHEKQRIAGLLGATGCVMMNWGHPENTAVPFGSVKPVWGNPTPENFKTEMATLPCIGIARTAGLQLREMLQSGPVRVWFRANVENGWRPVQITVGEIVVPGADDFVMVGGHQDSWPGPQATDNAAGNACIMELARVFAAHRDRLRRGLVCGFWTGHETGTMVGSSWFADRNWDRLRSHAVAYLQIDQPACAGTTGWGTGSNAELRRFHQAIEQEMLGARARSWHRASKTGDSSFFGLGIPMMAGQGAYTPEEMKATALASLGWWHHSIENTLDKLDWDYMQDHLRVYAGWLWELCTAVVLPFAFYRRRRAVRRTADRAGESGRHDRPRQCDRTGGSVSWRGATARHSDDHMARALREGRHQRPGRRGNPQRLPEAFVTRAGAVGEHGEGHLRPRSLRLHPTGHDDPVALRRAAACHAAGRRRGALDAGNTVDPRPQPRRRRARRLPHPD